jgi:hypothetical protein
MEIMKALTIRVFKNNLFKGCSLGGISEKYDSLYLICEDGNIEIDDINPPENTVKIVTRYIGGREYKHLEPLKQANGVGYMSGGAFGWTSDSRFDSDYPLSIHDRDETQEEYNMYSS